MHAFIVPFLSSLADSGPEATYGTIWSSSLRMPYTGDRDLLKVFSAIGLGKGLDAVVMPLGPGLGGFRTDPVVAAEPRR